MNEQLKVMKEEEVVNLCTGDRFVMYKVGPVLMANVIYYHYFHTFFDSLLYLTLKKHLNQTFPCSSAKVFHLSFCCF